jgi:hypothetical protein
MTTYDEHLQRVLGRETTKAGRLRRALLRRLAEHNQLTQLG